MKRKLLKPDPKEDRPLSISDAKILIEKIFKENRWGARERAVYFSMVKVGGAETAEDVRKIIADLGKSKMVLFD